MAAGSSDEEWKKISQEYQMILASGNPAPENTESTENSIVEAKKEQN